MATNTNKTEIVRPVNKLNVDEIKKDFPILEVKIHDQRLVYLDNAATTHKPKIVLEAYEEFMTQCNSNIHRGLHTLAEKATNAYENSRDHVARFIGGVKREEVIFTSGTTESINLLARSWGEEYISEGDEIVLSEMEHHANLVPWVILAQKKKAVIKRIPITLEGLLDLSDIENIITSKTKLVAISHMSNVLGGVNPIKQIAEIAHANGALILADGAQAVPHMPINVREMDVDFYAFSAHKMLGPTGVGVLYGREELLEKMPPFLMGGEMISEVTFDRITWAELPHKFEAGTPNIAGVATFDAAMTYLETVGRENIHHHITELSRYAIKRLSEIDGIEIQGPKVFIERGGAISFTDANLHPHDISTFLDAKGIAIRAGHHCAQTLMRTLGMVATARASLYIYNDEADIDALHDAIIDMRRYFSV